MSKTTLQIKDVLQTEIRSPVAPENYDLPQLNVVRGQEYKVVNTGSALITVRSFDASTLHELAPSSMVSLIALINSPSAAADWFVSSPSFSTATQAGLVSTGAQTIAGDKTFTSPVFGASFMTGEITMADDTIATIIPPSAGRGIIIMSASTSAAATTGHALLAFRTGVFVSTISVAANVTINAVGTVLANNAVDGVDGNLNIAVQTANTIIVKNRVGATRSWRYTYLGT